MNNQKRLYISLCFLITLFCIEKSFAREKKDSWTDYRGPSFNGISFAKNIPTVWNDSTNVDWKTQIPGKGWSSPVVLDDKIWITTALDEGKDLRILSVNAITGQLVHNIQLFSKDSLQEQHPLNSFASPTPALEKGKVYAHFGAYGTACVDVGSGNVIWKRDDFHCEHEVGPGSSPILYNDLLILTFDGVDVRFLVALDKNTGKTIWKKERNVDVSSHQISARKAFTTPIIAEVNGDDQLISVGPHIVAGYNPFTGEEIWRAYFNGFSASARPVIADNMLFFNSGFSFSSVVALQLGGKGDVTEDIMWVNKKSNQARGSALYIDGLLYMVNTGGLAKCFVAETGEELWVAKVGKQTSASPVYVGGNIFTFDQEGLATVFKPGKEFKKVGENKLPDGCMASPAIIDDALFLRTKAHLYKIVQK